MRFYPINREHVREEDRKILDGDDEEDEDSPVEETHLSEEERAEIKRKQSLRHVWVKEGEFLRAVQIEIGLVCWKHSEMVQGELQEDDELVIGERVDGQ